MITTAYSFSLGFASALGFGTVGSSKVENCRGCTIVTRIFSDLMLSVIEWKLIIVFPGRGGPLATSAAYIHADELPLCVHVLVHMHAYVGSLNVLQRIYSNIIKRNLKI